MDHTAHRFLTKFADRRPVTVVSGCVLWSTHVGKVRIPEGITLNNVLLIPDLACNIIFVPRLLQSGYSISSSKSACPLGLTSSSSSTSTSTVTLATAFYTNGLYTLEASYHPPSSGSAYEPVHADIWGPTHTASHGDSKYFLTCYDDHTKHIRIYCMKATLEAL
jgi:hypothetical protein